MVRPARAGWQGAAAAFPRRTVRRADDWL